MKIIVGNWKMYPSQSAEAAAIAQASRRAVRGLKRTRVVVCPPFLYTDRIAKLAGERFAVGAQDCFWEDVGARTGEVSAHMLAKIGATHVIIGHSERRALGETDQDVAKKAAAAIKEKLAVIVCVGERDRDEAGSYFATVGAQVDAAFAGLSASAASRIIVAYEPIWAIGSQALRAATPEDLHEMVVLIRKHLTRIFGKTPGFRIPILYGGSVDTENAAGYLAKGLADGLLIGRISLDKEKFAAIVRMADTLRA